MRVTNSIIFWIFINFSNQSHQHSNRRHHKHNDIISLYLCNFLVITSNLTVKLKLQINGCTHALSLFNELLNNVTNFLSITNLPSLAFTNTPKLITFSSFVYRHFKFHLIAFNLFFLHTTPPIMLLISCLCSSEVIWYLSTTSEQCPWSLSLNFCLLQPEIIKLCYYILSYVTHQKLESILLQMRHIIQIWLLYSYIQGLRVTKSYSLPLIICPNPHIILASVLLLSFVLAIFWSLSSIPFLNEHKLLTVFLPTVTSLSLFNANFLKCSLLEQNITT